MSSTATPVTSTTIAPSGTTSAEGETARLRPSRSQIRYATLIEMKKRFYFLTIPGAMRLLEIFFSVIHLGAFGYYDTFYDKIVEVALPPLFVGATREAFFLMVNMHTFMTCLTIVLASTISVRSHAALVGSLYFIMVIAASAGLLMLYHEKDAGKFYPESHATRKGLAVTGILLGLLHLSGAIYDLGIYVHKTDSEIIEP